VSSAVKLKYLFFFTFGLFPLIRNFMSSVERRRILFNRQILHQFLLMSFSLQENFLRVKSSNIRMSKCKSITTSGSFIELKYPMPACVGFESYEGFHSHLKCILGQIRPTPHPLCTTAYKFILYFYSVIYGEQLARKRESWNDCKNQYTTLYAEQQKFIDRLKLYPSLICLQHNLNLVCCWLQFYNVCSDFLGAEIYEKHY